MRKKILSTILAVLMIVTCLVSPAVAAQTVEPRGDYAASTMQPFEGAESGAVLSASAQKDTTEVEILVAVNGGNTPFLQTSDVEQAVATADVQMAAFGVAEHSIESALGMNIAVENRYHLVFNGFSFHGEAWMVDAINAIEGLSAMVAPTFQLIEPLSDEEEVDLTPSMSIATNTVGAEATWDLGYTGKGTVVAVIDTGIKQTHEAFSVAPEGARMDEDYLEEVFAQYGELMHGQFTEGAYYSEKMPYNWDYFDGDCIPNHTKSTHGSHVAGIVAGNNGADFKGIAPDAQIVSLQVFDKTGGASVTHLLNAMEDCVYLGVDAINMSMGISNGFESYEWPMDFGPVYEALEKAGVAVCVAAGNEAHSYFSTNYGDWGSNIYQWLSSNPDNGHIGTPGTYRGSFTVGNTVNLEKTMSDIFYVDGQKIVLRRASATTKQHFNTLPEGNYEVVYCGYGSPDDIAALGDVTGKILLAERGGKYNGANISFSTKMNNAYKAGAAGILVYNNVPGWLETSVSNKIPYAVISLTEGQMIIDAMDGGNSVNVMLRHDEFSYKSITMHKSSSWGPTAGLQLKPDISAPGTSINSVDGAAKKADNAYIKQTGTSMACPAVAGGVLLLREYLRETFPNASGTELTELGYALMMSTAEQVNAFVRQQGAGTMNLEKAVNTTAYLTTEEGTRPKLELDDSENGRFDIAFQIHNFGKTDKNYVISLEALTEQTFEMDYKGRTHTSNVSETLAKRLGYYLVNPESTLVTLINGSALDVSRLCTLYGEKNVTVKAGETLTVNLTLEAGEELMQYFAENCPDGMYLEGWVKLKDTANKDAVDLSIPFLGYVGDWDYPAVIDVGWWWQEAYGENNLAQFYVSNAKGGVYVGYGDAEQGLGINYYWDGTGETYLADRNALSPNNDGRLDALTTVEFSLLRQPRTVKCYIDCGNGETIEIFSDSYIFRKDDHEIMASTRGLSYSALYFDYAMENLAENETATFVLEAHLDRDEFQLDNNRLAKIEVPFTKDTIAPVVTAINGGIEVQDTNYVAYYAVYSDLNRENLVFEDGVFAMERGAKETYLTDMDEYFVSVADYARNEAFYYVKDGNAYVMDAEGFDHGRTIIGQTHFAVGGANIAGISTEFAWYGMSENMNQMPRRLTEIRYTSDDLEDTAYADIIDIDKAADGTIYASSIGRLYTVDPVTFQRSEGIKYSCPGFRTAHMQAMAIAPGTNDLYGLVVLNNDSMMNSWICSINPETAEVTTMWKLSLGTFRRGFDFVDEDTILVLRSGADKDIQFRELSTGAVESTASTGTYVNTFKFIGNFTGHVESILYDDQNNCIYLGGAWSKSRDSREGEQIVFKFDLDTSEIDFMAMGSAGGQGLFALSFLDELVDEVEKDCIYYRQEIAPTCDTEGYTLHTCADCGHEYRDNFVPALGHTYEGIVTEPTCTDMGYTTYTCTVCGDSYVADYTKPVVHEFVEVVIEPTCTEAGYTIYMCECGYEEIGDVVDPVGHNYEEYVVEPTCEDYGYTMYVCAVCGDSFVSEYTAPVCPAEKFSDVDTKQWYHEGVCYVIRNGLMNGKSETVFAPNANLTRAELVTVLYRMAGSPSVEDLEHPFADVADDTWYTDAVIWAYNAEVVKGISNTAFAPNANITREQIATILYRYAGAEEVEGDALADFADADKVNAYAVDAMNWAVSVGLINGMDDATLAPQGNATRAQIATILMRYCEG